MQDFHRSEEMPPHAHSRSVSVLSSTHGRHQEDDLSSIMMRGATDLRHAKFELEEQVVISVLERRIYAEHHFDSVDKSPSFSRR